MTRFLFEKFFLSSCFYFLITSCVVP